MPVKSKSTQLSENKLARNEASGLYAVVDIGSNSVRLVVYDRLSRAPLPRFNEKSLCRLADGLAETNELSEEGCRRTDSKYFEVFCSAFVLWAEAGETGAVRIARQPATPVTSDFHPRFPHK